MAAGAAGATPEEQAMAIAEDVLARLPSKILRGPSHEGDVKPADMTPMSIVVIQEAARYERLVSVVRTSSRAVIGAVQGPDIFYKYEYLFIAGYNNFCPHIHSFNSY